MAKTLEELRQQARRVAGLTADADAVSDLTLNQYINESFHELYDLIIDADDGRLFAKNSSVLPQVGEFAFRLPIDHYRLCSCHVLVNGNYVPAVRADPSSYPELADNNSSTQFTRPRYFHRWDINTGEQFVFIFPAPAASSVAVTYFPRPMELSLDGDSIDNPASFLSFIIYGAAIKMLNQLERDTVPFLIELRRLGQRIRDSISDLDFNSPATIRDTDGRYGGWDSNGHL